ncbi:hypothetical protein QQF64_003152 [Cirrhinus molitorella]|uniref:Uncharacterized protein n=1 Tax=Cirrhinus molitorella TaxID=172907 RepID=A0ABR3MJD0_9TELE
MLLGEGLIGTGPWWVVSPELQPVQITFASLISASHLLTFSPITRQDVLLCSSSSSAAECYSNRAVIDSARERQGREERRFKHNFSDSHSSLRQEIYARNVRKFVSERADSAGLIHSSLSTVSATGKVGQNPNTQSCQPEASLQTINDFLFKAQVDNINLFKVQKYFEKSMISQKLCGFVEKYEGSGVNTHSSSKNKENRRTEGLGRFLQTLQNKPK